MLLLFKIVLVSLAIFFILWTLSYLRNRFASVYSDFCRNDFDCPQSQSCQYDRDYGGSICVPGLEKTCDISPPENLLACDPSAVNFCANACINQPPFLCRKVTAGRVQVTNGGPDITNWSTMQNLSVGYANSTATGTGTGMKVDVTQDINFRNVKTITIKVPGTGYKLNDQLVIIPPEVSKEIPAAFSIVELPNPFKWTQGSSVVDVPLSAPGMGWCLPDVQQKDCNQFTSTSVLTQTIGDGGKTVYSWDCHCNNEDMFTKNPNGDCYQELACGYDGTASGGKLMSLTAAGKACIHGDSDCDTSKGEKCINGFCFEDWLLNKNTNPMDGECLCPAGKTSISQNSDPSNYVKECVTDSCANPKCDPGKCHANDSKGCTCDPAEFMNCDASTRSYFYSPVPVDNPDYWYINRLQCDTSPKCIDNPCNSQYCSLSFGGGNPTCNVTDPVKNSTIGVISTNNPIGKTCIDMCNDPAKGITNGITFNCGDRGTCTVINNEQACICNENYTNANGDKYCQTKLSGWGGPCVCNVGPGGDGCKTGYHCSGHCNFGSSGAVCIPN